MKSIILSLHKRWWEKIAAGEKVMEVRKSRPRTEGPFRVLVYVTGGVGICGEFICDHFQKIRTLEQTADMAKLEQATCLGKEMIQVYAGENRQNVWG